MKSKRKVRASFQGGSRYWREIWPFFYGTKKRKGRPIQGFTRPAIQVLTPEGWHLKVNAPMVNCRCVVPRALRLDQSTGPAQS